MNIKPFSILSRSGGSALIAIVAAVLLFSVLAAALVSMVGSAEQQTTVINLADRAYYLAESGYRYAIARFRHPLATDADDMDALENMEGEHILDGNEGRFGLKVYSFFYRTTSDTVPGGDRLTVHAPGSFAKDEISDEDLDGQQVEIEGDFYTLGGGSNTLEASEDMATFYVTPSLPATPLPIGTLVHAATETDEEQTLVNNGPLSYKADTARMFPLRNGMIWLQRGAYLTYRVNDRSTHRFLGVQGAGGAEITGMSVPSDTTIVLMPYALINATGIAGGGDFETRREVSFSGGLPWFETSRRVEFEEKFDTAERWNAVGGDTQTAVTDVGEGNPALQITSTTEEGGLATLETESTQMSFDGFRTASGDDLSYDTQVKVGFYGTTAIPSTITPMPVDVAAGLSFRINNISTAASTTNFNGYGLSFVKGEIGNSALSGILPARPANDAQRIAGQPLIVLWQQTGAPSTRQWLAYKRIQWSFFENFDYGFNGWTLDNPSSTLFNLWRITPSDGDNTAPSLNFGDPWGNHELEQGAVVSPVIPLCSGAPTLSFNYKDDRLGGVRLVRIIDTAGEIPDQVTVVPFRLSWTSITDAMEEQAPIDLSAFAGRQIQIRFYRELPEGISDRYDGWYIDDVAIQCEETWPVQASTLVVRLLEAATVQFVDGSESPMATGDWIRGTVTGTTGTVITPPIFSNAEATEGTLLLNNLTGTGFSAGETLEVLNRAGGGAVTVAADTGADDLRVNIIRAYYASAAGNGTSDDWGDPLDRFTRPYPRLGADDALIWPPVDGQAWTASNDYFRLIQWDGYNPAFVSMIDAVETPGAILRSSNPDLQSRFINAASPELGLHAYGSSANIAQTYFDDFGYQLLMRPRDLYPSPLQQ